MYNGVTSSNGEAAKTGAPGENTCTQCHTSYAINDPAGSITANVVGATGGQYQAGQTYQVTVNIAKVGASIFGFSGVALDATGANIGTIVAGSDNHTQSSSASGTNRTYVLQNMNGGLAADQKTFTFSWTAPATASGNVNFYFTGLAGNNNGGNSGDYVYSTTLTLTPASMGGGGNVVINEVDCDQPGADTQEFLELYGTPNMSLNGYAVVFFNGSNNLAYASFDLDGYTLDANGFFVLGNPLVPNVDLTFDPGANGAMQNGADAVALFLADATAWPVDAPVSNVGLVDALVYGTGDPDATGLLSILLPGQLQVNETTGNIPECLARVPNGGTPLVVTSYFQQLPTPGVTNVIVGGVGCMDATACNYDATATTNDAALCTYATLEYYTDADADGFGAGLAILYCSDPGAGFSLANTDCDDNNAGISPNATEICNGLDENCDGEVDEFVTTSFYADMDSDGFGDLNNAVQACTQPAGYVLNADDCDDMALTYVDLDGDGEGSMILDPCGASNSMDCNDNAADINTLAAEFCGNGIDENCDGLDETCTGIPGCMDVAACNYDAAATQNNGSCVYANNWYLDVDADGFYVSSVSSCTNPGAGYTSTQGILGDCNDADATINASAAEICGDNIDQDCSGADLACVVLGCTDATACNFESAATQDDGSCIYSTDWYLDMDVDGYASEMLNACFSPGMDYTATVLLVTDCDDTDATINPGAIDVCENGIDEDCSGADASCNVSGCMDATACNYNASATQDDGSCFYSTMWYLDADSDGYYLNTVQSCISPGPNFNNIGGIEGDCDDANAAVNAAANEVCGNTIDENCDGVFEDCQPGCPNPVIITLDSLVNLECFGIPTGYIGVSVTGGTGLYYAQWNTNPIQTTSYAHNLPAGLHSIYVHDTQGCGDTLTVEVTQPAGSFPVVSGNNDTAPAENTQYTVNTFPGATYTWTVTGGVIVSGQGSDTINVIWNDVQFGNVTVTQLSDSCELSDGITIFVNGVGIDEMETGISIYPNPALNEVNIQSNTAIGNWEIVDMSGRKISMGLENGNIVHLDVTDWSPGLYFVKTNKGIYKLMVQ
jgi:hypothetical protein